MRHISEIKNRILYAYTRYFSTIFLKILESIPASTLWTKDEKDIKEEHKSNDVLFRGVPFRNFCDNNYEIWHSVNFRKVAHWYIHLKLKYISNFC